MTEEESSAIIQSSDNMNNINFEDNEMIYQDSYNQYINSEETSNFEQQEGLQNEWTNQWNQQFRRQMGDDEEEGEER
jgi:hypothetical protein